MFLAGDIGGTKVNLALCRVQNGAVVAEQLRRYPSSQFASLGAVLHNYLDDVSRNVPGLKLEGACFGVPGPVVDGRCRTVNLPWELDTAQVAQALAAKVGCPIVRLINDLEATAFGLRALHEVDGGKGVATLRAAPAGVDHSANQALIAPGTGLGEAVLIWSGDHHVVSASEGGHTDFGPQDEEQIELLRWLWPRHKHVSWEHVASGPAIARIYRFLKETNREVEPVDLGKRLDAPDADASAIISELALKGGAPRICDRAIDLWLFCVGAEAGNLALKALSRGGIYIGGGIVPKTLELFRRDAFLRGVNQKGRMSPLVEAMGIYAVLDPLTALYGAALAAHNSVR